MSNITSINPAMIIIMCHEYRVLCQLILHCIRIILYIIEKDVLYAPGVMDKVLLRPNPPCWAVRSLQIT